MAVRAPSGTVRAHDSGAGRPAADTRTRILDVAERLVQVRGFNAFSYADIAAELAISKASLHHHFPSKARLGEALIARYAERFAGALAAIDADAGASAREARRLRGALCRRSGEGRMCLCGMLAAEYETLPSAIRDAVIGFLDDNEAWLERVLIQGREDKSLRFEGPAKDIASGVLSGLEGAMLLARSRGELDSFQIGATLLLTRLAGTAR